MNKHFQVVVIGGGTGGIMTASRLRNKNKDISIAIIEPSDTHYYQPASSLIGAGTYKMKNALRPQSTVIPKNTSWIKDQATQILPDENKVEMQKSGFVTYDYLIVATGVVNDLSQIEGLKEAVDKGVVCSNYINPEYTWENLQQFKKGNAIFTQPSTPFKCGGAPQKAMYMAADYIRKQNLSGETSILFPTPSGVIFPVKEIKETLEKVIDRYQIHFKPFHNPIKIDTEKKTAFFKIMNDEIALDKAKDSAMGIVYHENSVVEIPFNFMHLAPPQTVPAVIKKSKLINAEGWLDVDINSLQHKTYQNVFGVGDVAALPTAKTGAAIRKQAPVIVDNILKLLQGKEADNKSYDGYSSCPLITGYGKMALAEFNYKNEFTPDPMMKFMLVFSSHKEHWRLWMLKKYMLPFMYWNQMIKGRM